MKYPYIFYLVCVWDKDERLYSQTHFDDLSEAISYASTLVDKYTKADTIEIYVSKVDSIWNKNGIKEKF